MKRKILVTLAVSLLLTGCGGGVVDTEVSDISTTVQTLETSDEETPREEVIKDGKREESIEVTKTDDKYNVVQISQKDTMDFPNAVNVTKFDLTDKDDNFQELEINLYSFDLSQANGEPVEILQEIVDNHIKAVGSEPYYYTSSSEEEIYGSANLLGQNSVVAIYQDKDCYVRLTQFIDSSLQPKVLKISYKSDDKDEFSKTSALVERGVINEVAEGPLGLVRVSKLDEDKEIFDGKVVLSEEYFNDSMTVDIYTLDLGDTDGKDEEEILDEVQKLVKKEYTDKKKDMHIFTKDDKLSSPDKWGNADVLSENTRVAIIKNKRNKFDIFIREDGKPVVIVFSWGGDVSITDGLKMASQAEEFYYDSLYY